MKIAEFFAGSRSLGKVAEQMGYTVWSTDWLPLDKIDHVGDFMDLKISDLPFVPDVAWFSPDCAVWSRASGDHHFNKKLEPKTEKAVNAMLLVEKLADMVCELMKINHNMIFYIENPVGRLSHYTRMSPMFFGTPMRVCKVSQCQYGRIFQKNTHIFTNDFNFIPLPMCKVIDGTCHAANIKNAGDGKTKMTPTEWVRGKDRYYIRALLPQKLCEEILRSAHRQHTHPHAY